MDFQLLNFLFATGTALVYTGVAALFIWILVSVVKPSNPKRVKKVAFTILTVFFLITVFSNVKSNSPRITIEDHYSGVNHNGQGGEVVDLSPEVSTEEDLLRENDALINENALNSEPDK